MNSGSRACEASPNGAKLLSRIKKGVDEVHTYRDRSPECERSSYIRKKLKTKMIKSKTAVPIRK